MTKESPEELVKKLKDVVRQYLETAVVLPSLEAVEKNIIGQAHLASLNNCIQNLPKIVSEYGIGFDKEHLASLPKEEIEKRIASLEEEIDSGIMMHESMIFRYKNSSRLMLFGYLCLLSRSTVVSILSSSYICADILLRSMFELCVGMATLEKGGMAGRIDSISFLTGKQRTYLKKLWRELNGWAHPYDKWLKNICPIYQSFSPLYHERLFNDCVKRYTNVIDFFIVTILEKHEVPYKVFTEKCHNPLEEGIELVLVRSRYEYDNNANSPDSSCR